MKKAKYNSKKDVTKKKPKEGGKKAVKETREKRVERSANKTSTGKREAEFNRKETGKNTKRIESRRVKKNDAELELLNSLFLKELQKNESKQRKTNEKKGIRGKDDKKSISKSRAKLSFERKPNKENKRLRGNAFVIIFPPRSTFQQKINLINNWDGKELHYYVNRFSKLPQAIQVILTTKKGKDTFERATKISPFDFVVNVPNTKNFILEMMVSFQDNYIEYVESEEPLNSDWVYDPSKIIKVTVRFIY